MKLEEKIIELLNKEGCCPLTVVEALIGVLLTVSDSQKRPSYALITTIHYMLGRWCEQNCRDLNFFDEKEDIKENKD